MNTLLWVMLLYPAPSFMGNNLAPMHFTMDGKEVTYERLKDCLITAKMFAYREAPPPVVSTGFAMVQVDPLRYWCAVQP